MTSPWSQFVENSGVQLIDCKPDTVKHGKGLVVDTEEKAKDSVMVKVPKNALVNGKLVLEYAKGNPMLDKLIHINEKGETTEEVELPPRKLIARFLIYQILAIRRGTPDPKFAGWIQSMPASKDIALPFAAEDDDIQTLEHTSIFEATVAKKHVTALNYKGIFSGQELRDEIKEYIKQGPLADELKEVEFEVTFNDWILVEEWIASRALAYPDEESEELEIAMVPVVDLCNHSRESNAVYRVADDGSGGIELVTTKDCKDGEELCINYGPQTGSGEFMFNYGFIPGDHYTAGSCRVAQFFYGLFDPEFRKCIEPGYDPALAETDDPEKLPESEKSFQILVAFYDRRQSRMKFSDIDGTPQWNDDFIALYCCGEEVSLVENEENGYYELHFRGKELHLGDIEQCIKERDEEFYKNVIKPRGNAIVARLISKFFYFSESDSNKPQNAHQLFTLEQNLLKAVLEEAEKNAMGLEDNETATAV